MHLTAFAVKLPPDQDYHAFGITTPSNKRRYASLVIDILVVTIWPPIKREAMFVEDGEREDTHHYRPICWTVKLQGEIIVRDAPRTCNSRSDLKGAAAPGVSLRGRGLVGAGRPGSQRLLSRDFNRHRCCNT